MTNWRADRLTQLPPYLFVEIDRKKRQAIDAGRDVIDFGIGDPDLPTPGFVVDRMSEAIRTSAHHRYPRGIGSERFRDAVAGYMNDRFGVGVNASNEIIALIGSKEGIGHLPTAVLNPGETVLIPEPGYPVYTAGTIFAGGRCEVLPLRAENDFLPALDDIAPDVRQAARLMFLNYPNNPTSACASLKFFEHAVAFAKENNILIAHDAAYCDMYYDDPPPSILKVDGASDVAIEFHSLSKTFNMTGWRIAFAVGNADALSSLAAVKANLDSGPFTAIQEAAITALQGRSRDEIRGQIDVYRRRRDVLIGGLQDAGWKVTAPSATFYVWVRCPNGLDSMSVAGRILDETGVVVIPGIGFGKMGDDYIRFALTVSEERTREAVERIRQCKW